MQREPRCLAQDRHETWLVLAIGLLLVAFPAAHGIVLPALYVPVTVMLISLILRGVAFDFRAKVDLHVKPRWNFVFAVGSITASLAQGYMLGVYVLGLDDGWGTVLFGLMTALCLTAAYAAIGAAWLIHKTAGDLQKRAVAWLRLALVPTALGMAAISAATPLASSRILDRWLGFPETLLLAPLPVVSVGLFYWLWRLAARLPLADDQHNLSPFIALSAIFTLGFLGLAWSFFPYVVPGSITIVDAASAPESLAVILVGTLIVLPAIAGYTVFAYRVFGGKADDLRYRLPAPSCPARRPTPDRDPATPRCALPPASTTARSGLASAAGRSGCSPSRQRAQRATPG